MDYKVRVNTELTQWMHYSEMQMLNSLTLRKQLDEKIQSLISYPFAFILYCVRLSLAFSEV